MIGSQSRNTLPTAERILLSAERLFVEYGFESTSLRNITQDARVNLAAVNYHFGSKDALIKTVFTRHFTPYLHRCQQEIDSLVQQNHPIVALDIVHAIVRPAVALAKQPERQGRIFVRLLSRMMVENHRLVRDTLTTEAETLVATIADLLQTALPDLQRLTLHWRIHFMFNLAFHAFAGNDVCKIFVLGDAGEMRDPDLIASQLMPYLSAALQAPEPDSLQPPTTGETR